MLHWRMVAPLYRLERQLCCMISISARDGRHMDTETYDGTTDLINARLHTQPAS